MLSKDIHEEVRPTGQKEGIKEDELEAVFEARGKTTKDKLNKIDKTELPELSAKEVSRMGFPAVPTTQEPMATVPKLDLKVINLPKELIFAAQHASEPIYSFSTGAQSNNSSAQNKDNKCFTYYTVADQVSIVSNRYRSRQDLPI